MTRKYVVLSVALLTCIGFSALAQKKAKPATKTVTPTPVLAPKPNPVIFAYGSDTVYQREFERLLYKNKPSREPLSEKEVREYLELYINFKLKVKEAMLARLDTNASFVTELAGYRKQLAAPYLTDKSVTEDLMKEAYERMKWELNAGHILIICGPNAQPSDTLAAYNKLIDLRKRTLKGESFDSLAMKYSEDPSAKKYGSKLGWFSAFTMVYPFENAAYKTTIGEVSMPFRTQYGYHIIKMYDKRAARGEVKVAHIMIRTEQDASEEQLHDAKAKADTIYSLVPNTESFDMLVEQYSDDMASKRNKGNMWVGSLSGYPDEFKEVCFKLKEGEVSKPFKTNFGYHIVKFVERKPLGEFKDQQETLKKNVMRDSRSESTKAVVVARVKKENGYKENPATLKLFISRLDSTFIKGNWTYDEQKISTQTLFSIGSQSYTERDFAAFVKANQQPLDKASVSMTVSNQFRQWADDKCMAYEESILDKKHESFRDVMQEYHDGILLFELTDKMVWSKAVNDTTGLESYYLANSSKYMWKERVKYTTYTCTDDKTKQEAMKMLGKGKSQEEVFAKLNKKTPDAISAKEVKHEKTDATAEKLWDKKGVVDVPGKENKFHVVSGVLAPENKALKEAKGLITSDYQNYLEKEWITRLRSKYTIQVNEPAVKALYAQ